MDETSSIGIGVIGLGAMGMPIAIRLLKGGFDIHGCDPMEDRRKSLAASGGASVEHPSGFPERCTVFLMLLPNPEITHGAVFGEHGLAGVLEEGDVLANLGTIGPDAVVGLDSSLRPRGVHVLDVPMGKSSKEAAEGTLSLMVSGEEEIFRPLRPLFEQIAADITFCGEEIGIASTVKIINNLVSATILEAVAEGLVLGAKAGVPLGMMVEALSQTGADSWHLRNTFGRRVAQRDFEPGFSIDLAAKDLKIGLDAAYKRDVPLPVISQSFQRYIEGSSSGLGNEDWGALVKLAEQAADTRLQ